MTRETLGQVLLAIHIAHICLEGDETSHSMVLPFSTIYTHSFYYQPSLSKKMEKKNKSVASTLFPGLLAPLKGKPMINLDHLEGVKEKKTKQG